MSADSTSQTETKLWGIHHTDRKFTRVMGDPLRTTVEAPTKVAEEETAKLGFT